ncbi:MAG: polysaccharide biosynthesis C-terminal domain-containing protein [Trichloromonas sp.]|nr:polysaccharide biosynthesis C-terminal domain-containing protein [Trichloromonas sp.]
MADQPSGPLVGTIARYASSNLFRQVLGVVNAFLKPKLLSPELFGLWNLLSLIPNYAQYIHLGSRSALRYQIPANRGRPREAENGGLIGAVYYGTLALSLLLAAGLLLAAVWLPLATAAQVGLATMAAVVLLTWYFDFQVTLLKATEQFRLLGTVNFFQAGLLSLLNLVLILALGLYGLYAALLISSLAGVGYIRARYRPPRFAPYRHRVFLELVRTGLPIMAFSMSALLIRTADRFLIAGFLGLEALGYYGIATMAFNLLMQIPGASREVLEPKLMQAFAHGESEALLGEYLVQPLLVMAYVVPALLGTAILLLPGAVTWLLPRYLAGVPAAQLLLVGGYFLALTYVLRGVIVAQGQQWAAALLTLAVTGANLGAGLLLLRLGLGLPGVALASGGSFLLLFLLQWWLVRRRLTVPLPLALTDLAWPLVLPVVAGAALLALSSRLPGPLLVSGGIGALLYGLLCWFYYNRAARRYGYFPRLALPVRKPKP